MDRERVESPVGGELMALQVGHVAPDFELPGTEAGGQVQIRLSNFREKKRVVLAFHPLNWTPT